MSDFKHFSIVAGGELVEGHEVPDGAVGPNVVSMKVWAADVEQAVDVYCEVGNRIGFKIDQNVEVHRTPAQQAQGDNPTAYDVRIRRCTTENQAETVQQECEILRNE
ncbi:hypothetical protein WNY37_04450 [Henriciella sp. AS95]|uniref:hypothetical protein n=1 Tax=Henriciella sp. AS95 TaxID=3135782 RepID=UPI00318019E6